MRTVFGSMLALAVFAACAAPPGANAPVKLTPVATVPKPTLPSWIESISPTSNAQSLSQIRVIFAKAVTKVESLEGDGPRDVLSHIQLDPPLPGHFVVLTPRMIGFVPDRALPLASRVRVTLTAGLSDLDGDVLAKDLAWTFETDALTFTDLPSLTTDDSSTAPPVSLMPTIRVSTNTAVDPASLAQQSTLHAAGVRIALDATLEATPTPMPGGDSAEQFDASQNTYTYDLTPRSTLKTATTYRLEIAPGLQPLSGNVATANLFTGGVRTYDPLVIEPSTAPSPGDTSNRFADGDPVISFNNILNPKSIAGNITVSPAPATVKSLVNVSDGSSAIAFDPYAFDPNATYTVTLGAGIKDIFGQTLGVPKSVVIETSSFTPGEWAPSGTTIIPAGSNIDLNFYATNLPQNRYQAAFARVDAQRMLDPDLSVTDLLPPYAQWPTQLIAGAKNNQQSVARVPLQQELGAPFGWLAYGFRSGINADSDSGTVGVAEVTNLGVFAQWFPSSGIVLVQHLSDGASVGNANVTVYRRQSNDSGTPSIACAQGRTNANGEYDLIGIDLERCYVGIAANTAPNLGVVVTEGADVAALVTYEYSGIYSYSVPSGWVAGAPLSCGTIASDRSLYQPGEHAQLTGFAYYVGSNGAVAEKNATYKVQLQNPSGTTTTIGSASTDAYGIFSFPYTFSSQQALGYYTITATGPSGNQITGTLRVAEFKPPNFKLGVSVDRPSGGIGATINATGAAAYLFGAPLEGGKAQIDVTRGPAQLAPAGWDAYTFGPQWFWPDQTPDYQADVAQSTTSFDRQGNVAFPVTVPSDLPFPMTYQVDVTATDVSNLAVSDSTTFLALPSEAIIGLQSDTVVAAGSALPVKVIVTDADGHAISGRSVHLELQKMTYTSATQDEDGGESAQEAVRYDTVDRADVFSEGNAVTAQLHPPDNASYRIRANFSDARTAASATDEQVFAYGAGESDWNQGDASAVTVTLDKKKYKIGDTATAVIASPFDRSDVYVAVVRNGTLARDTLRNVNGAPKFTFTVTPAMLPNAALEAVVVRRGTALSSIKPGKLDSLARVGVSGFNVDLSDRYLKLGIAPAFAKIAPGQKQRVAFTLTDTHGALVRGKIVAMVVNDAVLQLSGYRLPDLVTTVFADQPISTRFADNRAGIALQTQTAPLEKGFGYGGGFLEGAASTRVRTNFRPLACYGTVETDASGKASFPCTLPDDLTTWRVMAVAIASDDAHFGTSDATFVSTLPLMANPLVPQFARPGDRFDLGLSAMNTTDVAGTLAVGATLDGALAFATGSPTSLQANESLATGMQAYRFPVNVGTPAPTNVTFKAVAGAHSDGFTIPFRVRDRATTESVIDSGASTKTDIPLSLDRGGSFDLDLANSAVPQFITPAATMLGDDPLPITSSNASRAIVAYGLAGLAPVYRLRMDFDPVAIGAQSVRSLLAMQESDGGFKPYANATESDPFDSAYAMEALAFAHAHGGAVDANAISRGQRFASDVLANPERFTWCKAAPCVDRMRLEMLWALAASGDRRTDFLAPIVAHVDSFDSATQVRLARYLLATPGWQAQGNALAQRLRNDTYVTGRYTVAQVSTRWGWLDSLVDAQAEMTLLMIDMHAPPDQIDGAVRALAAQQCRCGWPTIGSAASSVEAIAAYAGTEHLSSMTVTASVGGNTVARAQFGNQASSKHFHLAAADLHGAALSIASNGGPVHYLAVYTYDVPNDAPGALSAFRVVRTVSDAGSTTPLATMDLSAIVTPTQIDAGHVFDIGVRVIVDHPVDRVVIEDPLPAGLEAVDTSFSTASNAVFARGDSWDIDSQQIYADRVVAYAGHLGPGIYDVHYLARSVTPGTYRWPGARAYLSDAPEQFGRSAASLVVVK